jgi:hypothetical protein
MMKKELLQQVLKKKHQLKKNRNHYLRKNKKQRKRRKLLILRRNLHLLHLLSQKCHLRKRVLMMKDLLNKKKMKKQLKLPIKLLLLKPRQVLK